MLMKSSSGCDLAVVEDHGSGVAQDTREGGHEMLGTIRWQLGPVGGRFRDQQEEAPRAVGVGDLEELAEQREADTVIRYCVGSSPTLMPMNCMMFRLTSSSAGAGRDSP